MEKKRISDERLAELKAEGYLVPRRKLLKTEEQIAKIAGHPAGPAAA